MTMKFITYLIIIFSVFHRGFSEQFHDKNLREQWLSPESAYELKEGIYRISITDKATRPDGYFLYYNKQIYWGHMVDGEVKIFDYPDKHSFVYNNTSLEIFVFQEAARVGKMKRTHYEGQYDGDNNCFKGTFTTRYGSGLESFGFFKLFSTTLKYKKPHYSITKGLTKP
jgi:hypothetical protein